MPFLDRREAGRRLAERLRTLREPDVVVLGITRGGVPVAYEVATALRVPLESVVVRKLAVPQRPWLVFGALGEDGIRIIDSNVVSRVFLAKPEQDQVEREQRTQLRRSVIRYRLHHERQPLGGTTAVIVDDGLATGATAHAACMVARARGADRIVFATAVGSSRPIVALSAVADQIVCLETPQLFSAIRPWYLNFESVTDAEACALFGRATENARDWASGPTSGQGSMTAPRPVIGEPIRRPGVEVRTTG